MTCRTLILVSSLLLTTAVAAHAEIYSWTDDRGTVHFTEDGGAVPAQYRGTARQAEDNGDGEAAEAVERKEPAVEEKKVLPKGAEAAQAERYSFTTREEWEGELRRQEAAMAPLRQRLDEISAAVAQMPNRTIERDILFMEHRQLREEFGAMKARYLRLVEAARGAGFKVDLEQ